MPETIFPANHWLVQNLVLPTKSNCNQVTTQKPPTTVTKTTNIYKTNLDETEAWFKYHTLHPARKWNGSILRLLGP